MSAELLPDEPLFTFLREACAEVARRARLVKIDSAELERFASVLSQHRPSAPPLDPAHLAFDDESTTVAFAIALNAVNFGSGWFPSLKKSGELSGYRTIATALRRRFEREGAFSAAELARITRAECARLFGQDETGDAGELMGLFAAAWNELGRWLANDYGGAFAGPVKEARGSAERLTRLLARLPMYQDVAIYQGFRVPFLKRAQITCADLATALRARGLGRFDDLGRLTIFADNLVPHTLRMLGVLEYDLLLLQRIEREEPLVSGSEEEVEIRAAALHAVELLSAACARRGFAIAPHKLDLLLWSRGQSPAIKAKPRHRTRCTYY
ncbi:MAG TPA: queuosine salvage family protein [Myxococcota bacterium]|nr:queuosine salvage family protein [Myxococcota bacterium]